ncbi:HTTM domain-containing protein [Natronosalvus vescus]|uniref:HTTM domain-containing protein n=1 Tax=Natronosalvus vescus TaxID=2953881 RepID=UPI002091737C|nr:HTTM domain-containing protein [Natronosalvus vescus]
MVRDTRLTGSALRSRVSRNLKESVTIDARSLAVFRVFVGLLIIADVLLRSRNFWFFYTDEGVVPRSHAMAVTADNAFSIYHISTDPTVIAGLMIIQVLIAIQLIVGYKTRLATILSFLFVISLDYHNPFVTSYADVLFRLLVFWAIFLPLGERWSIDAVHRERNPRAEIASVASTLILGQMVFMYFYNGYHKAQSDVWGTGEAAPLVLGLDDMTFLLAEQVRAMPTLLSYGGLLWYAMMLISPLLLVLVGRKRMGLVALFMGGHFAFAITVRIGAFAYVAMAGLLLFIQPQIWRDGKAVLRYFDVDIEKPHARLKRLEHVAHAVPDWRLRGDAQRRARSQLYTLAIVTIVVTILLFSVGPYLPAGALVDEDAPHKQQIESTANAYMISQPDWTVFAPNPRTTDRYHVFVAQTDNGELLDVYNDRPLTFDRPHQELQKQYGTYRERFYMNSVRRAGDGSNTPALLAEHLCTTWEEEHDITLTHINMYVVSEDITIETINSPEDRDRSSRLFYEYGCGDHEPEQINFPDSMRP